MTRNTKLSLSTALLVAIPFMVSGCYDDAVATDAVQGWKDDQRSTWYEATQGSRMIPKSWFDALEQADNQTPFATVDNLSSFGFLPPRANSVHGMPIGFTVDRQADADFKVTGLRWYDGQKAGDGDAEPWVGMNCAACHTGSISYKGKTIVVDGAPSLVDFQSFVEGLDASLKATRAQSDKWDRFNDKILNGKDTPANREKLTAAFDKLLAWQDKTDQMNETEMRYGYGRLDAVGHIFNKVLMFTGSGSEKGNESNAPVSYPFLWNMWRQGHVQWNGIAANSRLKLPGDALEYGALGRNTGEVLGVFGDIDLTSQSGLFGSLKGYSSSVRPKNLMRLEIMLQSLTPPAWPEEFPPVDTQLVDEGSKLFAQKCAACHKTPDLQKEGQPTEVMLPFENTSPQNLTDIWMACNAYLRQGPAGPLEGVKDNDGNVTGEVAPVASMLGTAVKGALIAKAKDVVQEGFNNFFAVRKPPVIDRAQDPFDPRANDRTVCLETKGVPILAYKSRPLDGIWATSPYLHNGSVASLYELLLPAKDRTKQFWVGGAQFDPDKVGYVTTKPQQGNAFLLKTHTDDGKLIEGNSNKGHEYGASDFGERERKALVEYMKTL